MEIDLETNNLTIKVPAPYRESFPPNWIFIAAIFRRFKNRTLVENHEAKLLETLRDRILDGVLCKNEHCKCKFYEDNNYWKNCTLFNGQIKEFNKLPECIKFLNDRSQGDEKGE
jgi:hypothetical protein